MDLPDEMIVIGHAMGSGMILLVNQNDWKGIYFWDNALDYKNSTEDECLYKIAGTFSEFLNGLYLCEKLRLSEISEVLRAEKAQKSDVS
jgi:hypothetical protein